MHIVICIEYQILLSLKIAEKKVFQNASADIFHCIFFFFFFFSFFTKIWLIVMQIVNLPELSIFREIYEKKKK